MTETPPCPVVISTAAQRSRKSHSPMVCSIATGDLSTQRFNSPEIFIPIPPCPSARDDGGGRQHTVISKGQMTETPPCPVVISTAAQRSGEIPTLYGTGSTVAGDLSTQSFNSAETHLPSHRHDAPLEMTVGGGQQWRHFLLREQKGAPKCSFQIPIFSLYAFARPEARHSLQ